MADYEKRLIERGFPCHQVGAETQRERGASSALPPLYFLHVWWARRPLIPSRAAILASLSPAETDPELFLRQLGIERVVALVDGNKWVVPQSLYKHIEWVGADTGILRITETVVRQLEAENECRAKNLELIEEQRARHPRLAENLCFQLWEAENLPLSLPNECTALPVEKSQGNPAWSKEKIEFTKSLGVHFPGDPYGYTRAFANPPKRLDSPIKILDPTAGGGSIAFEALRLGGQVIANELNPVGALILHATLDYPGRFGLDLLPNIKTWGQELLRQADVLLAPYFPVHNSDARAVTETSFSQGLISVPESQKHEREEILDYILVRQVTCPQCKGEAPLLNTCWLSKEAGDLWAVQVITDGKAQEGKVSFRPYRVEKGRRFTAHDPDFATVSRGVGWCIHCRQAISGDEIKAQARGESPLGRWTDRLYAVVAVRHEPVLDKNGNPQRYASGERKGQLKTRKVRFFRAPNERDLEALHLAEKRLAEKWDEWDAAGLIPTEAIPEGNDMRPINYGMPRWCDLFTPRQLLCHLTLVEALNRLKPRILDELGPDRGRAVVTYLQFAIDKGLDYNSRQTRWHYSRGVLINTFGRHDFSLKWTFGEMVFTGPNSGAAWGLSQVIDAYSGIAELLEPVRSWSRTGERAPSVTILNQNAAHMPQIPDRSVDLVCMDPPYYNNVMYAELSDFFYVWQRRTLSDLYPELFHRRLTNKEDEAVANPVRDGSARKASRSYERKMAEIFAECRRVVKDDGLMTIMFTHKTQEAWETLTRSLIETGWTLTSSFPVESESATSLHQKDMAAAASSIFLTCRKRAIKEDGPSFWTGIGGQGVQARITEAVREALAEFKPLRLNPVDQMVACYGRALHVLSENWPVMDGDDPVGPHRAMLEASRVVAAEQVSRLTGERLSVADLDTETGTALTLFGIYGLAAFPYDDALNLSRSLNVVLMDKAGGYRVEPQAIGVNRSAEGGSLRSRGAKAHELGYHAPLIRAGSKLRLARPEERNPDRLEQPQTEWDVLQGLIQAYRSGDAPVARAYLQRHARDRSRVILDLLEVWGTEVGDEKLRMEAETIRFDLKVSGVMS